MRLCNQSSAPVQAVAELCSVGQVLQSLGQRNALGTVIMRFERCVYLQCNEQLVCIGLNTIGASSISGLFDKKVQALPQCLIIGATVQLSAEYLLIDNRVFIDSRGAELYVPMLCDDMLCDDMSCDDMSCYRTPVIQQKLLAKLTMPSAGLAPLLRQYSTTTTAAISTSFVGASNVESELVSFVMPAIVQLANQLRINCAECSPNVPTVVNVVN